MRGSLQVEAELQRLARALGVERARLAFLDEAGAGELRELRDAVSERLLARDRERLQRAVALARHLPAGIAASLAEHALGAQLAARAAALMDAEQLGELAGRLELGFLADVASHIDVRFAGRAIEGIDPSRTLAVSRVLVERGDWVTLGAFADGAGEDLLVKTTRLLDGEGLLRVALAIEDGARLDEMLALLDDGRLRELVIAADEQDLLTEALLLLSALDDGGVARVGRVLEGLESERRERLAGRLRADAALREMARRLIECAPATVRAAIERAGPGSAW